jgi:uncharacterized membrane protein
MPADSASSSRAWSLIEQEKRRDRFIRRVSIIAWSVTFLFALIFTVMIGGQVIEMVKANMAGILPFSTLVGMAMPLIIVLGFLSLLIATLSTVGIFLRLRTASLAEIQLRLASLEDMLASRPDSVQEKR